MAAKDFLRIVSGRITQVFGIQTSAGAADAGKIAALDDTGRFDVTMMPVGVVADNKSIVASENIGAGSFVNVFDSAGTIKVRKADATASGKEADGFVLDAATTGNAVLVYFEGTNTALSALTKGARYYLDTTAGGVVSTPPSTSGNVVQYIGRATSATEISFEPTDGVILA